MLKTVPELVQQIRENIRCVSAKQALDEINNNQGIIIDVREPMEVQEQTVPVSLNIPRGLIEMKMSTLYPDAKTPIYIHCATGARATFATEQLQRIGYQQVSVITCDIDTICKDYQE